MHRASRVAVLGLVFFAAMLLLNTARAWRHADLLTRVSRLGLAFAGVGFATYLIYTELFTIHAICLWCTTAHVLAFLLFGMVMFADSLARPSLTSRSHRPDFTRRVADAQ